MMEDPVLIHSQLVGMGKNNKKMKIILKKRTYRSLHMTYCAGSTQQQHAALAVVQTQNRTYTAHCTGSSTVQTQNRTYTVHCTGSSGNTKQDLHSTLHW